MSKFGIEAPPEKPPCPHRGHIESTVLAGFVIRQCGECGRSWALAAIDDGFLGWVVVKEQREFEGQAVTLLRVEDDGDSLGSLGEDLLPVPDGEDDAGVLTQPDHAGRLGPPVQDLPEEVELDAAAGDGEKEVP